MPASGAQFLLALLQPGRLPAVLYALTPSGTLALSLLPSVKVLHRQGASEDEAAAALTLVSAQRDVFFSAWAAAEAPVGLEARLTSATYDAKARRLLLSLYGGAAVMVPVRFDPRLEAADDARLGRLMLLGTGQGLCWPALGYALSTPALLQMAATASRPEVGATLWEGLIDGEHMRLRVLGESPPRPPQPAAEEIEKVKSLLGLILQREGFVEQAQLQDIYQEQRRLEAAGQNVSFGQAAVALGHVTQAQLDFALHLQNALGHTGETGKPLGVYLLEAAALAPSVLLSALEEQKRTQQRLGEILVRRGAISEDLLQTFLGQQGQRGALEAPSPEPVAIAGDAAPAVPAKKAQATSGVRSLLGIILEREDYMSQQQVRDVITEQDRLKRDGQNRSFGEVALALKFITMDQLKFAVQLQGRLAYSPGKPKPLGFYLLENGVVKPSQLQVALEECARTNKRVGEVLVEQGVISQQMLEVFLRMQREASTIPAGG